MNECPICFDLLNFLPNDRVYITTCCGKISHRNCLDYWLQLSESKPQSCPFCLQTTDLSIKNFNNDITSEVDNDCCCRIS